MRAGLIDEWRVEAGVVDCAAAAEGGLGAELLKHELLNRVVKNAVAGLDGQRAGITGDLVQPSFAGAWAPGDADARRPGFVVGLCEATRYSFVARKDQAKWEQCVGWAGGAAICGAVGLHERVVG